MINGKARNGRPNLAIKLEKPTERIKVKILIAKKTKMKGRFILKKTVSPKITSNELIPYNPSKIVCLWKPNFHAKKLEKITPSNPQIPIPGIKSVATKIKVANNLSFEKKI